MLGAQAKTQPRPEIISEGPIPAEVNVEVMLILLKGQPAWLELDLKTKSLRKLRLNVQGLLQHLKDPPLPRGTTLGGLAR